MKLFSTLKIILVKADIVGPFLNGCKLKVDIDFDSDEEADRGMMGYYAKPTPEGKEKYREIIAEIQADAKRDLGMDMPEELIREYMGLKEPVEHIKIFHKNVYAQLKEN